MKRSWPAIALCGSLLACGSGGGSSGASGSPGSSAAPPATSSTAVAAGTSAPASSSGTAEAPAAPALPGTPSGGGIAGPATEEGAKAVIAQLQTAPDPLAVAKKLKPGLEEINAWISDSAAADAISKEVEKAYARAPKNEFPKGEPAVFCAKSEDVKAWTPEVRKHFPGGYKRLKDKLNSGITMCKFKIGGLAFDSLVNIKGSWYLISKPFRAVRE